MKRSSEGIIIFDGSEPENIQKSFEGIIVMLIPVIGEVLVYETYFDTVSEKMEIKYGIEMKIKKITSGNPKEQILKKLLECNRITAESYPEIAMDLFTYNFIMGCNS